MRSRAWWTASMFVVIAVVGSAAPAGAAPAYPKADGRCVDQTGVLGRDLCAKVTAVLLREERVTSDEIAVVVVPTTGDAAIEGWSTGLFNAWGVGKKGRNNGVLLVVAIDDHKVRLETGRGIADRLSDGDADSIVGDITAHFGENDYALGILTGLDEVRTGLGHTVAAAARLEPLAATAPAPEATDADDSSGQTLTDGDDSSGETLTDGGDSSGETLTDGDTSWSDGSDFTAPDDLAAADDGSPPLVPIVIGAFVVVVLIGALLSRSASGSSSAGDGRRSAADRPFGSRSPTHTTWVAGSSDAGTTSTPSSFDSSGGAGSSFGGGSSDGGGSTGSW